MVARLERIGWLADSGRESACTATQSAKPCTRVRDLAHRNVTVSDSIGRNDAASGSKPWQRNKKALHARQKDAKINQELETTLAPAFWADTNVTPLLPFGETRRERGLVPGPTLRLLHTPAAWEYFYGRGRVCNFYTVSLSMI